MSGRGVAISAARPSLALFWVLAQLRAANADSLYKLAYADQKVPYRTAMRQLAALVSARYLAHTRLRGSRCVYSLTSRSLAVLETHGVGVGDNLRHRPRGLQGDCCWLRGCLWAALKADGYTVGRSANGVATLRRILVDAQEAKVARATDTWVRLRAENALAALRDHPSLQVPFCFECRSCAWRGGLMVIAEDCGRCKRPARRVPARAVFRCGECQALHASNGPHTDARDPNKTCTGACRVIFPSPFDIAWRERHGRMEALILFIDDPGRPLRRQLTELPLGIDDQPPVPIIVRSVDPDSRLALDGRTWISVGPRHRALLHAFRKRRKKVDDDDVLDNDTEGDLGAAAQIINPYGKLHLHG